MNYSKLKIELNTGSYSSDPNIAAQELNALTVTKYTEVVSGLIRGKLAEFGKLFEIKAASEDANHALKDVALAVMLTMQPNGGIDFSNSENVTMLDGLASGFGLTTEQRNEILALGEYQTSRAQELGLGRVEARHILKALAGAY